MKQAARQTASTLGKALAISLALHALLLLQEAAPPAGATASGTPGQTARLDARLHGEGGTVAPVDVPRRANNTPANTAATTLARSAPTSIAVPSTMPARGQPKATSERPPAALLHATDAAARITREESRPDGTSSDAEGLRQYRIDLAVAARRFRDYPTAARSAGIGGVAGVRLAFAAAGLPPAAELDTSSGNALLDAAAVAMLGSAARTTPLPARLRGQTFAVVIPVEFDPRAE